MEHDGLDIVETMELPEGMVVDLDEGWPKLVSRQFGGDPGRAFCELVQNLLDSYPVNTPWEERRGVIESSPNTISITDYGEGIGRQRLRLLLTLGGTDKWDDPDRIGQFGLGFFSIFNPLLGTLEVVVTTRCEEKTVELTFTESDPGKRPEISACILEEDISFSTRIEIRFDRERSVRSCLRHALQSLKYYPCRVTVNGEHHHCVWDQAKEDGADHFQERACRGFLKESSFNQRVTVLCRYERITDLSVRSFITGGHNMTCDLRDFAQKACPFVPGVGAVINSMTLRVTIGRDSFYLGPPYHEMVRVLAQRLLLVLGNRMRKDPDPVLILANQYIFRQKIKDLLTQKNNREGLSSENTAEGVFQFLVEAKIFRVKGREELYSLLDLKGMHSPDLPFYYCLKQMNVNWLGGAFRHDFILLPSIVELGGGAPDFFETLFGTFFGETVNLDTIREDREKIKDMVARGIADKSALTPELRIKEGLELSKEERGLLDEMDDILAHEGVRSAIAEHLHLHAAWIRSAFFEINESGATISTGLFNGDGEAVSKEMLSNVISKGKENIMVSEPRAPVKLLVGVNSANPLIEVLSRHNDPHRAYYALTLLANKLTQCQHLLTPHSPFYHVVKDRLANDMRKAMMDRLVPVSQDGSNPFPD